MLLAARLGQEGYAPKVLVSGPGLWYGTNEADLAIDFRGKARVQPAICLCPLMLNASSTSEERRKRRSFHGAARK